MNTESHSADTAQPVASGPLSIVSTVLSKDQANKVLGRNMANLAKKVANGKTLTATERALVEAMAAGQPISSATVWASDQVELADALGITRRTVQRWRSAGAPTAEANGKWSVAAWKEWMRANGKEGGLEEEAGASRQQLEARRLLLMNEKLEIEIGILRGEYMKATDVCDDIRLMVAEVRKVGEGMPSSLAPQLAGLSVSEIEKRLRSWWDEYCFALHTGKLGAA